MQNPVKKNISKDLTPLSKNSDKEFKEAIAFDEAKEPIFKSKSLSDIFLKSLNVDISMKPISNLGGFDTKSRTDLFKLNSYENPMKMFSRGIVKFENPMNKVSLGTNLGAKKVIRNDYDVTNLKNLYKSNLEYSKYKDIANTLAVEENKKTPVSKSRNAVDDILAFVMKDDIDIDIEPHKMFKEPDINKDHGFGISESEKVKLNQQVKNVEYDLSKAEKKLTETTNQHEKSRLEGLISEYKSKLNKLNARLKNKRSIQSVKQKRAGLKLSSAFAKMDEPVQNQSKPEQNQSYPVPRGQTLAELRKEVLENRKKELTGQLRGLDGSSNEYKTLNNELRQVKKDLGETQYKSMVDKQLEEFSKTKKKEGDNKVSSLVRDIDNLSIQHSKEKDPTKKELLYNEIIRIKKQIDGHLSDEFKDIAKERFGSAKSTPQSKKGFGGVKYTGPKSTIKIEEPETPGVIRDLAKEFNDLGGWEEKYSERHKRYYWKNKTTGETIWEDPALTTPPEKKPKRNTSLKIKNSDRVVMEGRKDYSVPPPRISPNSTTTGYYDQTYKVQSKEEREEREAVLDEYLASVKSFFGNDEPSGDVKPSEKVDINKARLARFEDQQFDSVVDAQLARERSAGQDGRDRVVIDAKNALDKFELYVAEFDKMSLTTNIDQDRFDDFKAILKQMYDVVNAGRDRRTALNKPNFGNGKKAGVVMTKLLKEKTNIGKMKEDLIAKYNEATARQKAKRDKAEADRRASLRDSRDTRVPPKHSAKVATLSSLPSTAGGSAEGPSNVAQNK